MRMFLTSLTVVAMLWTAPPATAPAAAQATSTSAAMSDMDRLLAPIALYPDALLAQMLLCASNTTAVVRFHMWLGSNTTLKGSELQDAATVAGFDPSFVALAIFPQVIKQMAEDPDWTTRLGKAFAADKTAVFASIQKLRGQAASVGTLKDTPQQNVETKTTSNGQQVIVIEPANPQIVYVPTYNPQVVYTTQPTSTTVVVQKDDDDDEALAALIGFGAGIALGAAMDNDYYYGPYGWRGGGYMYNDAWDDFYDHREDAREDWIDHRENLAEERSERVGNVSEQRTERLNNASEQRTERLNQTGEQRTQRAESAQQRAQNASPEQRAQAAERQQTRQATRAEGGTTRARSGSFEASGYSGGERATRERSGTSSGAFSGYSSGRSERAASSRGSRSRSGGGGGRRR